MVVEPLVEPPVMARTPDVAELLARMKSGDEGARRALLDAVYRDLHARATALMRAQRRDHTLQPTALVHEAYIKLLGSREASFEDARHFFATAARAMRAVLVDHARGKRRDKRTSPGERVPLDELVAQHEARATDLVALDEALEKLARFDEPMARAVELRFFGGLSVDETARLLGMPRRSFERHFAAARAWLHAEIR